MIVRGNTPMRKVTYAAVLALVAFSMSMTGWVLAQDSPALSVVPSKVTMLIGETHTFRAVGRDGRLRHNIRWSVSPEHGAKLTANHDDGNIQDDETLSLV